MLPGRNRVIEMSFVINHFAISSFVFGIEGEMDRRAHLAEPVEMGKNTVSISFEFVPAESDLANPVSQPCFFT